MGGICCKTSGAGADMAKEPAKQETVSKPNKEIDLTNGEQTTTTTNGVSNGQLDSSKESPGGSSSRESGKKMRRARSHSEFWQERQERISRKELEFDAQQTAFSARKRAHGRGNTGDEQEDIDDDLLLARVLGLSKSDSSRGLSKSDSGTSSNGTRESRARAGSRSRSKEERSRSKESTGRTATGRPRSRSMGDMHQARSTSGEDVSGLAVGKNQPTFLRRHRKTLAILFALYLVCCAGVLFYFSTNKGYFLNYGRGSSSWAR